MMINKQIVPKPNLRQAGHAILVMAAFCNLCSCSQHSGSLQEPGAVYVCSESGELFLLSNPKPPVLHPETGKPSLKPGLYCEQCQQWKPAPPREVWNRMPRGITCRKCQHQLKTDGPLPQQLAEITKPD